MKKIRILLWIMFAMCSGSLLQAAIIAKLWSWFLYAQYGKGPTLGGWFGISVILNILTRHLMPQESEDMDLKDIVIITIARWCLLAVTALFALGIGAVFGWVS